MATSDNVKLTIQQLRDKANELEKLTEQDVLSERARDALRKRRKRAEESAIVIPRCANPIRRRSLEAEDEDWLRFYCGKLFWYPFTEQQRAMITAIRHAIKYGGDQALAASRGEGKTKLFERMLLKYTLTGEIDFSILFAATGDLAINSLQSIRTEVETNPRLLADYPEACYPVHMLENRPNRAHFMAASGFRHDTGEPFEGTAIKFTWCGEEVFFPRVPGSPSRNGIIAIRGLDSAVRGINVADLRPKVVGIDDPDTEETVRTPEQAIKLQDKIELGIAGLGGQQQAVARILLTTLQSSQCCSAWFTDPKKKAAWKGRRFRYLLKPPTQMDPWEEYMLMWQQDKQRQDEAGNFLDEFSRRAHAFYLEHRATMDAGAEVANVNRFDARILPDGSQLEVSALQSYFNAWAKNGEEYVRAELDNDPTAEIGPLMSGINAHAIQMRLSGYGRGIVPPGCVLLTQGIDVKQMGIHWVVRAWLEDGTVYTIDYGFNDSYVKDGDSKSAIEHAVRRVIRERAKQVKDKPYKEKKGKAHEVALTLVDCRWMKEAVIAGCDDAGLSFQPSMGHGKSEGCATANFSPVSRTTRDRKPGDGWFLSRVAGKVGSRARWIVNCDTDRWKSFEHARWMTAEGLPGAAYLFGKITDEERRFADRRMPAEAKEHTAYSRHITAEVEVEDVIHGILKRVWRKPHSRSANHWLDGSYLSDVAAAMKGITLLPEKKSKSDIKPGGWFAAQEPPKRRSKAS